MNKSSDNNESTTFPKYKRLLTKSQFLALKQNAKHYHTKHFLFLWRANSLTYSRLGLIITKRVTAKATRRNRIRRLLREAFRLSYAKLPLPLRIDLVVVVKIDSLEITFNSVNQEIKRAIQAIQGRYDKFFFDKKDTLKARE